jgi:hypothetical protein
VVKQGIGNLAWRAAAAVELISAASREPETPGVQ